MSSHVIPLAHGNEKFIAALTLEKNMVSSNARMSDVGKSDLCEGRGNALSDKGVTEINHPAP